MKKPYRKKIGKKENLSNKKNKRPFFDFSSYEPIYASSSTVLTSVSNLAVIPTQPTTKFDHIFHVKSPLKYSQSCCQTNDSLSYDYYRSLSSLEPIYLRTNKPSNASLIRKVHLAQLRDDTAILY
jgi:hypothetical protein